jgi:hypothetical protein
MQIRDMSVVLQLVKAIMATSTAIVTVMITIMNTAIVTVMGGARKACSGTELSGAATKAG